LASLNKSIEKSVSGIRITKNVIMQVIIDESLSLLPKSFLNLLLRGKKITAVIAAKTSTVINGAYKIYTKNSSATNAIMKKYAGKLGSVNSTFLLNIIIMVKNKIIDHLSL
jgi:pheromone shutdown protein TraB